MDNKKQIEPHQLLMDNTIAAQMIAQTIQREFMPDIYA